MSITKILLVTGKEAFSQLESLHEQFVDNRFQLFVHQCPVSVISLSSPQSILNCLQKISLEKYDLIMISGLIPWNPNKIEKTIHIPIIKGPKFASQITELLKQTSINDLKSLKLAEFTPYSLGRENFNKHIKKVLKSLKNGSLSPSFSLSSEFPDVIFSPHLPPVVLGEIVDFPLLSNDLLFKKIELLIEHGADIIDLGCVSYEEHCARIQEILPKLRKKYAVPFSIDSGNASEIRTAVKYGASMVLSLTPNNFDQLKDIPKDITVVCLIPPEFSPSDYKFYYDNSHLPFLFKFKQFGPLESSYLKILVDFYYKVSSYGFKKILLDPLLSTPICPGLVNSLQRYWILRHLINTLQNQDDPNSEQINLNDSNQNHSNLNKLNQIQLKIEKKKSSFYHFNNLPIPQLFAGASNVIELMDADSPGITALLSSLFTELQISGVLLTEHSKKCHMVISEFQKSSNLMFLAKVNKAPPINLGMNAFSFKSKREYTPVPTMLFQNQEGKNKQKAEIYTISPNITEAKMDPSGFFKIYVDLDKNQIVAVHYTNYNEKPRIFIGNNAESLYKNIFKKNLVSRLDHAAYLGKELYRAELALKFGTAFEQN
ncbi:DUF4346 domain-containing protein [Candidatus Harpocratesius sp.]